LLLSTCLAKTKVTQVLIMHKNNAQNIKLILIYTETVCMQNKISLI